MEKQLFELIIKIKKKCLRTEERIRGELKLTPGEFHGLLAVQPGERLPGQEFSDRLDISASRGSRVINRLVQRGFMELNTGKEDRRSIEVFLTEDGISMGRLVFEKMVECESTFSSRLNDHQINEIRASLELLLSVM